MGLSIHMVGGVVTFLTVVTVTSVSGQLDLPSMPGPPYPDPRGNNRWGVKFDPRKHGPPFDKRGSAQRNVWHRGPPSRPSKGRDRDRDRPSRERDSYWSPGKMRRHSRPQSKSSRNTRFYGNELTRRRPRLSSYRSKSKDSWRWPDDEEDRDELDRSPSRPSKAEQEKFWKSWNAWYKKQVDVKEQLRKGKSVKHAFPYDHDEERLRFRRPSYLVDAEEFKKLRFRDEDDYRPSYHGNSILGRTSFRIRDFYRTGMRDIVRRAKSLTSAFTEGEEEEDSKGPENPEENKPEGWNIFTTIGKGLDAANDAMGTVRKTVGGSVIGTGIKYGGKMAMGAVMNVGTSALTSAIQSTVG